MLPQLRQLQRHFPGAVQVIGVHSAKFPAERVPENLRAAVARLGVEHPIVADPEMRVWDEFAVRAWPTIVFIDPQGKVIGQHAGEFALDPTIALIAEILAGHGITVPPPLPPETGTPVPPTETALRFPTAVVADPVREQLLIADGGHHQVVLAGLDGTLRARVGDGIGGFRDGGAREARFATPRGLALTPAGDAVIVADSGNHTVRRIDLTSLDVTTIAGTGRLGTTRAIGQPRQTSLRSPWGLAWAGGELWIAMAGSHQLWAWDPARDRLRIAAGSGAEAIQGGTLATATFAQPSGLASHGDTVYSADPESSGVRAVDWRADHVRRLLGRGLFEFGDRDGRGDTVLLQHDEGVAVLANDGDGTVYIADTYNDKIKRLDPRTRAVTTIAGGVPGNTDGTGAEARFWAPSGLSVLGDTLLVADTNNHAIRQVALADGHVTTLGLRLAP